MSPTLRRRHLLALPLAALAARRARADETDSFAAWLERLRRDALAQGVRPATLERTLAGLSPIPRVIELDQRQPEQRLTFAEYRAKIVTPDRVERGHALLTANAALLRRVEGRFGVPARVIVALWGIESNFGQHQGSYPVVGALATLAYEGRRAEFFRKELINALLIVDSGDVAPEAMLGSWAGAMGQSQFMPSTFLAYAFDFDHDGRRDIWGSLPDVFASTANYLARIGWDPSLRWGRAVDAPDHLRDRAGLDYRAPLGRWRTEGVRLPGGGRLPASAIEASLLQMDGSEASYLVYPNFRTIMNWNRSTYFALCVGLLSDLIETG